MDNVSLTVEFIDKYMLRANPSYAMVYLCAYRFSSQRQAIPDAPQIAKLLGMKISDVTDAISYWNSEGFSLFENLNVVVKTIDKSIYSAKEIALHTNNDKKLKALYSTAESLLGKMLSTSDLQTIFWIYDYLGLSPEIIILLINYASKENRLTMRYIEKVAVNWLEQGIDTPQKAEQHLDKMDKKRQYESKIKNLFGVDSRDLTSGEKVIVQDWEKNLNPSTELLNYAFELCVQRTGKLSIRYINGILKSWSDKGVKTPFDAQQEKSPNQKAVSTKFSNFTQRDDVDYNKLELQALQKRINKIKE